MTSKKYFYASSVDSDYIETTIEQAFLNQYDHQPKGKIIVKELKSSSKSNFFYCLRYGTRFECLEICSGLKLTNHKKRCDNLIHGFIETGKIFEYDYANDKLLKDGKDREYYDIDLSKIRKLGKGKI